MTFEERVREGQIGVYKGLSNGFNRINKYIFGLQRSCYYLLGGNSGSGKTTLADYMLINAIEDAERQNMPINVFYYSLEINEVSKKANWLSVLIHQKYDIIITPEKIKGLGDFRLNEDELEIVKNTIPDLEKLWSKINWIWESANPTGIYKSAWQHMSNRGTFKYSEYKDENGEDKKRIEGFELHNKNEYNVIVGDHLALLHLERGFTLKENLDKISEYSVKLRNLFGMTIIWLQQFNDGLSSIERIKFKGVDISPQQTDFKDSRNPYTDADVVLGIMNAYKLDMESCLGYNINIKGAKYNLLERFRLLKIIKNRLSRDGMSLGLLFIPEAGNFEELPYPGDINQEFIDRINKLNK
jgi:replicative DNA helicase